jgi:hypothetical protein
MRMQQCDAHSSPASVLVLAAPLVEMRILVALASFRRGWVWFMAKTYIRKTRKFPFADLLALPLLAA